MKTYKEIVLEKVSGATDRYPIGSTFSYTYKSKALDQALQSATKQLEFWKEDRLNWKVVQ